MIPDSKKSKTGQFNSKDRLSDLPDFIIHYIISYLGTKEAYRTSVLSKRWTQISATNPVLEFHHYKCSNGNASRLLEYIDTRMQKYSKENLRIKTFTLAFPATDLLLACKVDEWIEIAVRNQVVTFDFTGPGNYKVPPILFSAKSLRRLDCSNVEIPYYEVVDLVSLEYLDLSFVIIEQRMLCHIVSSCPLLTVLRLSDCSGFNSFVIPRCSKLEILDIAETLLTDGRVILENSSLKDFQYIPKHCLDDGKPWPILSKGGSLRNLRSIRITSVDFTDEALAELLRELVLLEELVFWGCHRLTSIKISNTHLKEICLHDCYILLDVVIDAPSLKKFKFDGEMDPSLSITISSQTNCNIHIYTMPHYFDTDGFFKLKKLLTGLTSCHVLKILLLNESFEYICDYIEFDEEENADLGPPCDIRELNLNLSYWELSSSSLSAFVNGLLWACHPCIISMRVDSGRHTIIVEPLVSKLEDMVKCWRHPLKRIEVEETNNGSDFRKSRTLDVQLRLYW